MQLTKWKDLLKKQVTLSLGIPFNKYKKYVKSLPKYEDEMAAKFFKQGKIFYTSPEFYELENKYNTLYASITVPLLQHVNNWIDLTEIYALFTDGLLPGVPTYQKPLTVDVRDNLFSQIIRKYKIITVDSQGSTCDKYNYQRPYVEFYADLNRFDILRFEELLINNSDFLYFINSSKLSLSNVNPKDFDTTNKLQRIIQDTNTLIKKGNDIFLPLTYDGDELYTRININKQYTIKSKDIMKQFGLTNFTDKVELVKINIISREFCNEKFQTQLKQLFSKF